MLHGNGVVMPAIAEYDLRQVSEVAILNHAQPQIVILCVMVGAPQAAGFYYGLPPEDHRWMGQRTTQFAHVTPDLVGSFGQANGLYNPAFGIDNIDRPTYQSN